MIAAMTSQTLDTHSQATVRGILESCNDDRIVLGLPGTEYHLHLTPAVPAATIRTPIGKRIKGTIHAKALRIFKASGGGTFIEPLDGAPRIVAGRVLQVDQANRRVLVDVAVPMWMTLEGQRSDMFSVGDMVNCYVESGTRFTPQ